MEIVLGVECTSCEFVFSPENKDVIKRKMPKGNWRIDFECPNCSKFNNMGKKVSENLFMVMKQKSKEDIPEENTVKDFIEAVEF